METARRAKRGTYTAVGVMVLLLAVALFYAVTYQRARTTTAPSTTTTAVSYPLTSDWLTYHLDNLRDGDYSFLPPIASPSLKWKATFDGAVYSEPLVFDGSVFIATESDTVYSVSAATGAVEWTESLGTPAPLSTLLCGDIDPVGITGTPVIDPSANTLYVVAMEKGQGYTLFALNTSSGSVLWSERIDPPGFNFTVEQERGALTLYDGVVYVPFGGFAGDCGQYHGWVVGYPANGTSATLDYQVPSGREAGIWTPGGVVVSTSGKLYLATGNSASRTVFDYGEADIELRPNLTVVSYFAPQDWVVLNDNDLDLGSLPPVLLSDGLLFQIGKQGIGFLLNSTALGGVGGQLYSANICGNGFGSWGAEAFYNDSVYVPCDNGMFAISVHGGASPSFGASWNDTGFNCGPPILAAGALWTIDVDNGTLLALNPETGATLFTASIGQQSSRFTTPSAGDGLLYAAAGDTVFAFSPQ